MDNISGCWQQHRTRTHTNRQWDKNALPLLGPRISSIHHITLCWLVGRPGSVLTHNCRGAVCSGFFFFVIFQWDSGRDVFICLRLLSRVWGVLVGCCVTQAHRRVIGTRWEFSLRFRVDKDINNKGTFGQLKDTGGFELITVGVLSVALRLCVVHKQKVKVVIFGDFKRYRTLGTKQ